MLADNDQKPDVNGLSTLPSGYGPAIAIDDLGQCGHRTPCAAFSDGNSGVTDSNLSKTSAATVSRLPNNGQRFQRVNAREFIKVH
jgi:hypothetical protein